MRYTRIFLRNSCGAGIPKADAGPTAETRRCSGSGSMLNSILWFLSLMGNRESRYINDPIIYVDIEALYMIQYTENDFLKLQKLLLIASFHFQPLYYI